MAKNIFPERGSVNQDDRTKITGVIPQVFWFYGLSGSGKSAVARRVEKTLVDNGILCYRIDGDNLRNGLNSDLGFSIEDRIENIRRAANAAWLVCDAGVVVLATFITPLRENRRMARDIIGERFNEIYVKCSVDTCSERDPKGLYVRAFNGEIQDFTGVSSPFEEPEEPVFTIDTEKLSESESAEKAVEYILEKVRKDK
ncbi:MAG TPA: adenylyl-sulfate kinase [Clostridia bacterium]|nr:adenylyl-sulfate kinase [Clostridia bacterium]HPQ47099.1 adenylyl-sulfate kinase [Clostridia bacterium]HRX41397.1 adenylyl-sulfate kinase [Clostridia bacterium]